MSPSDNVYLESEQNKSAVNHGSYFDVANRDILTNTQCT